MSITQVYLNDKADFAEELGYRDHANILREAAAAIANLTAERDDYKLKYNHECNRHDLTQKRVQQLDADRVAIVEANKLLSERVEELETALDTANTALEDWLHKYAPDECKQERVEETKKRISDAGGTLAYLANVFATIRRALAVREAK